MSAYSLTSHLTSLMACCCERDEAEESAVFKRPRPASDTAFTLTADEGSCGSSMQPPTWHSRAGSKDTCSMRPEEAAQASRLNDSSSGPKDESGARLQEAAQSSGQNDNSSGPKEECGDRLEEAVQPSRLNDSSSGQKDERGARLQEAAQSSRLNDSGFGPKSENDERLQEAAQSSRQNDSSSCPQDKCGERLEESVQSSGLGVKADGSVEQTQVPSPKVQDYHRTVEQLGPAADSATKAADDSSQACAPVPEPGPLPTQQQIPCQPAQDSNGGALPTPLVLESTASALEVPDPPLAVPAAVSASHRGHPQEEPSQLSLDDAADEGDSRLAQTPTKLDGEAQAGRRRWDPARRLWHVNSIDNLSDGLASKFQERRNREATGESAVGNIHEQRSFDFEPAQLEDRLALRFQQIRAKESDGTPTSFDSARGARRSDGIAIVDKVLEKRLARQRLLADCHYE